MTLETRIHALMSGWADAGDDVPLAAGGFESYRYRKD